MAQGSGSGELPEEIMRVMPTDPYEQLDLARKITSMAIASRVSRLELEGGRMRQAAAEKDRVIDQLQEKLAQLDLVAQEAHSRLRVALEENIKLAKERDALSQTSKKLSRDLAKLETFKRHLMQSLNDDNSSQQETVDIRTCEQSIAKVSSWKNGGYPMSNLVRGSDCIQEGVTSTCGSPRGFSTAGSPKLSGANSPNKTGLGGHIAMSPWFPSSKQSSAANSPPRARPLPGCTPRVDGKEFFRQARSRLSYEQFGAFLANIKELNSHRQSREETLKKAEEIFGVDNKDLYISFQGLLNRNLP